MKPVCYTLERHENTWVASADGRGVLSFENEQVALATIEDATARLGSSMSAVRPRLETPRPAS
jgi:hypothetical protein